MIRVADGLEYTILPSAFKHGDDVGDVLGHGTEALLVAAHRVLGLFLRGDVAAVRDESLDVLVVEQVGGDRLQPPPLAAMVSYSDEPWRARAWLRSKRLHVVEMAIVGMHELEQRAMPDRVLGVDAEEPLGRRAHVLQLPGGVVHRQDVGQMLSERSEPFLAGAARGLGVLALLAATGDVPRARDDAVDSGVVDEVDDLGLEPTPRAVSVRGAETERLDSAWRLEHTRHRLDDGVAVVGMDQVGGHGPGQVLGRVTQHGGHVRADVSHRAVDVVDGDEPQRRVECRVQPRGSEGVLDRGAVRVGHARLVSPAARVLLYAHHWRARYGAR